VAAAKLIGRTGARSFQIRYSDDEEPTVWMAVGEWSISNGRPVANGGKQTFEAAAGMDPLTAVLRLLDQMVDGGMCTHCNRPTGITDHWQSEMPMSDTVCWYTYDPELEEYRRSCEGDTEAPVEPEPSSEKLAQALEATNIPTLKMLAARARRNEFHDFKAPHAMPQHVLVAELRKIGGRAANDIAQRVIDGEFDATKTESDAWAASPEGQATMNELLRNPPSEGAAQ